MVYDQRTEGDDKFECQEPTRVQRTEFNLWLRNLLSWNTSIYDLGALNVAFNFLNKISKHSRLFLLMKKNPEITLNDQEIKSNRLWFVNCTMRSPLVTGVFKIIKCLWKTIYRIKNYYIFYSKCIKCVWSNGRAPKLNQGNIFWAVQNCLDGS